MLLYNTTLYKELDHALLAYISHLSNSIFTSLNPPKSSYKNIEYHRNHQIPWTLPDSTLRALSIGNSSTPFFKVIISTSWWWSLELHFNNTSSSKLEGAGLHSTFTSITSLTKQMQDSGIDTRKLGQRIGWYSWRKSDFKPFSRKYACS